MKTIPLGISSSKTHTNALTFMQCGRHILIVHDNSTTISVIDLLFQIGSQILWHLLFSKHPKREPFLCSSTEFWHLLTVACSSSCAQSRASSVSCARSMTFAKHSFFHELYLPHPVYFHNSCGILHICLPSHKFHYPINRKTPQHVSLGAFFEYVLYTLFADLDSHGQAVHIHYHQSPHAA